MTVSVIVEFRTGTSKLSLVGVIEAVLGVRLEIERETATIPTMPNVFFRVTGADLDAFEEGLKDDHSIAEFRRLSETGGRVLYWAQISDEAEVVTYPAWVKLGAEALSGHYYNGRWHDWMRFLDRASL